MQGNLSDMSKHWSRTCTVRVFTPIELDGIAHVTDTVRNQHDYNLVRSGMVNLVIVAGDVVPSALVEMLRLLTTASCPVFNYATPESHLCKHIEALYEYGVLNDGPLE